MSMASRSLLNSALVISHAGFRSREEGREAEEGEVALGRRGVGSMLAESISCHTQEEEGGRRGGRGRGKRVTEGVVGVQGREEFRGRRGAWGGTTVVYAM
jgi:hypothetical protein